ncbi:glycoside hydrolase family 32 protein [Salinimonas sediminis]|uniref:Glycoside hydrolase family 32 protein n=2 Tax=Salinimonas sediminis TaxID=2303538 RepID=A0A346NLD7_9ALTE|nr:glycoside hydrolase family 32 protein [Salinimonas sediminis]AXR06344.1 glycoside hydrolase family 32 protein [Salinimonas sediminis]
MKLITSVFLSSALIGCSMSNISSAPASSASESVASRNESFRPQVHFSPKEKWMNDPNGMFFLNGEYHLFFQHNPNDSVWGPMHWGHAVSKDLLHWEELPIALYPDEQGTIFSGSAVVDWNNTSGLGTVDNPPIVALYTYHNAEKEAQGRDDYQTQAMAYSLDQGRTWKKHSNNPVIENPGIADFRDPKVMWHADSNKWIMALAQKDHIGFYSSPNLIDWTAESTFGKDVGDHGGVWECPELLLLPVEGSDEERYVLLVSISPGGPNGGSATQYFVGDFDGKNFTLDKTMKATLAPTEATFPSGQVFENFESTLSGWNVTGEAFTSSPVNGGYPGQPAPEGYQGAGLINSFADKDLATGTLVSPEFTINQPYINFRIGGGNLPGEVGIQLLVDNKVVKTETGKNTEQLTFASWNVQQWAGKTATLQIIDEASGSWGHTYIDDIVFADQPATNRAEPAIWLDYGTDNYAGVTFFTSPSSNEQRRIFMGWMSNWLYANEVPTQQWRSAMTLPRTLHLTKTGQGLRLQNRLIAEVDQLAEESVTKTKMKAGESISLGSEDTTGREAALRYRFKIASQASEKTLLSLENDSGEAVFLTIDTNNAEVFFDRRQSGRIDFSDEFATIQHAPLVTTQTDEDIEVVLVVDRSSVELFIDNGTTVMTMLVFPTAVYNTLQLDAKSSSVSQLSIERLASIWADE